LVDGREKEEGEKKRPKETHLRLSDLLAEERREEEEKGRKKRRGSSFALRILVIQRGEKKRKGREEKRRNPVGGEEGRGLERIVFFSTARVRGGRKEQETMLCPGRQK